MHLDDTQFAGFVLDDIFDEFRKFTDWPREYLQFQQLEKPLHQSARPSEVLAVTKVGARGVKAIFICGKRRVEEVITIQELDRSNYELKIGQETMAFNIAEMPCCPPFAPGMVISILGARVVMGVLQDRFCSPPPSDEELSNN